jgi:hypothetical protein
MRNCRVESLDVGVIFLRQGDSFVPMRGELYEAEELLQALIADHPEVLAGDESGEQSAWLLVKREAGVGPWSLDHLYLDHAGVPTLVEVKRSSDTRARREVVAQMLDYAANAAAYWSAESLRAWFEAECEQKQVDPEKTLSEAFGVTDSDGYWETVKTNLAADRIRLVFVADEIPSELRSIIELLNRQMSDIEVFAIEVKQYVDAKAERHTFVPRVIGQTEAARAAKRGGARHQWDKESLLDAIADSELKTIAEELIDWADSEDRPDVRTTYGTGSVGSASVKLHRGNVRLSTTFFVWTDGSIQIPFYYLNAPFSEDRDLREEFRRRINEAVPGANIPPEGEKAHAPYFSLGALSAEQARQEFFKAIEWAFNEVRRAQAETRSSAM